MKEVLRTHQQSLADAARVSLEAEGIEAVLFDEHALSTMGLSGEIRVMVPDPDVARALTILRALEVPRGGGTPVPRSWQWQRPGLKCLAASLLLFPLTGVAWGNDWPTVVTYGLFAAASLATVVGLVLLIGGSVIATREQLAEGRDD